MIPYKKIISAVACCVVLFQNTMSGGNDGLPQIGAQVFIEPGQKQEDVETWFRTLRDSGMKVCRIRLHESHINRNGQWDFSIYDHAFDLAEKYGIKVFATLFPNDSKNSVGGEKFPESKRHFKEIEVYIDKTVEHYKDHPAMYAWVVQNEPGVNGKLPENEFTEYAFSKWEKRRESIENGYIHISFDRDEFLVDYETWYLGWIADRIRQKDSINQLHLNNHQIFKNVAEYDFPSWRKFLSSLGASAHPSWHYGYFDRQEYALAMTANCNIIRSGAGELPFWVTELQAGNNIYSGTVPICPTEDEITQWLWTGIANGARGVIFWSLNPRSATGEPGEWALLTLDNQYSDRMNAACDVMKTLNKYEDLFSESDKYDSPVTILYNRESLWAEKRLQHEDVRQDEGRSPGASMKESLGIYQACAELGISPEFSELREFDWNRDNYSGQVLVIAHQIALPDEYSERIKNFVALGGKLIVTGLTGFFGTNSICTARTGFLFEDLFGASFKEVKYQGDTFHINLNDPYISIPSHMWMSTMTVSSAVPISQVDSEVIAARNFFGKGEVLWIPSLVGIGKRRNKDITLSTLLQKELSGITCPVMFAAPQKDVIMNTMQHNAGYVTVIVNKNTSSVLVPLRAAPGYTPKLIYSSKASRLYGNGIANLQPEETLIINWTR